MTSSAIPADSFNGPPPHQMELNPQQGRRPLPNGFAGLEQPSLHINILPPELSQSYWQHLQQQQLQGGVPFPSRWPIDPPNMPDIHVIQQPPPTNSWVKDFDGKTVYVGRAKVEELDSDGNPVNPKTPRRLRSLEMLSPSVTPPPAPRMDKKSLEPGSAGWGGTWGGDRGAVRPDAHGLPAPLSPVDSNISTPWNSSQLQTMVASGFLYPHEPNLHEANQRLSDHMLRSTGYVPASSLSVQPQRALNKQSENGNIMSPSTTPGIRRLRREHPLRKSYTFSELGSEFGSILGEKPRLPDPPISLATQNQRLQDLLTDSVRLPENTRQARDRDNDENNTRQTSSLVHPPPRVGPFDQQRMPSLHPSAPSDASTELLETDVPPIPAAPPVYQPSLSTLPSDTGRGSFATDHFPLSSTPPPRHRQRHSGRATPWPAPSRRRADPAVPPARHHIPPLPPPPTSSAPPPIGQHEAELLARISWWMGVGLTGTDSLRRVGLKVEVGVHPSDACLVFHACRSSLRRPSPH